ncbi:conserved Plasmodium protein, unknown function [Plasmodium gallinaceum]|uniref:Ribosomal protein L1 n=1 Tax=Plasmodium gallinaceum TaxID=5849 RepID=A0A1J1GNK7_PLAGA|nr:conserved Plasmodium protein, unknown function [Plasmodium gallinaceum]CRG94042.1 conserved Plasmodium protein, unknown function [Plasmodium gallinaceum]
MKGKNKKKEIFEKKKKENKKFLDFIKANQKYEKFQKAILNNKSQKINKKVHNIKLRNKTNLSVFKTYDIIEKSTFYKAYDFIVEKGLNDEIKNLFYDSYILYCNFDLSSSYNLGKYYNFSIDLTHSYYSDVILFVYENSEKWKKFILENKIKKIKKVMTFDKFESVYYKEDLLNEITNRYDLYIFDSCIRTKKYTHLISKIKKNNKTFTTLQLNEETFVENINKVIRKTYTDLNKGSTHSVPIGYLSIGKEKLYDNIKEVAKFMLPFYEQKKVSVVSINLRYINMTIPLYIHALKYETNSESN